MDPKKHKRQHNIFSLEIYIEMNEKEEIYKYTSIKHRQTLHDSNFKEKFCNKR